MKFCRVFFMSMACLVSYSGHVNAEPNVPIYENLTLLSKAEFSKRFSSGTKLCFEPDGQISSCSHVMELEPANESGNVMVHLVMLEPFGIRPNQKTSVTFSAQWEGNLLCFVRDQNFITAHKLYDINHSSIESTAHDQLVKPEEQAQWMERLLAGQAYGLGGKSCMQFFHSPNIAPDAFVIKDVYPYGTKDAKSDTRPAQEIHNGNEIKLRKFWE